MQSQTSKSEAVASKSQLLVVQTSFETAGARDPDRPNWRPSLVVDPKWGVNTACQEVMPGVYTGVLVSPGFTYTSQH